MLAPAYPPGGENIGVIILGIKAMAEMANVMWQRWRRGGMAAYEIISMLAVKATSAAMWQYSQWRAIIVTA